MSGAMRGSDLMAIRHKLGMSQKEFGRALGFAGKANNIKKTVDRMEQDVDGIGERTAQIARAMLTPTQGVA